MFQVVELGKIVSLLLSLSGRLVRVENALLSLDWNGVEEREELEARRGKLMAQLDEASMLKESIEQTLDVWAEVRSVTPFFWNHQFELIFHNVFPKTNRFSSLVTKPLRKFFLEDIFQFLQVFGINSDSK